MARDEFCVDVAGKAKIEERFQVQADQLKEKIATVRPLILRFPPPFSFLPPHFPFFFALRQENDRRDVVIRRITEECWDSMEVTAVCVRAFTLNAVVHNFAIRKLCVRRRVCAFLS